MKTYNNFAEFKSRTFITGKITLLTALHIGRGQSIEPFGSDLPVVKDAEDKPYIPGSSLKGILRSNAERISGALHKNPTVPIPCFITDEKASDSKLCLSVQKENLWKDELEAFKKKKPTQTQLANWYWEKICPVCRLFGSPYYAAKIAIKDLEIIEDTWFGTENRNGVAIDRGTETAKKGQLYEFEVVPAGVEFRAEFLIENSTDEDLGLLYLVLKDFENGRVFIGGNRTKGLGNVKFEFEKIEHINATNLSDYLINGEGTVYSKEKNKKEDDSTTLTITPEQDEILNILLKGLKEFGDQEYFAEGKNELKEILGRLGITRTKINNANLGEKVDDLLKFACQIGKIEKEGRKYRPKRNLENEPKETIPESWLPLNEYEFNEKIESFINWI
ncbi:MAG: type III CRISPR-associated RAMP protein Csx7 [Promethearchaeota archaeon]